MLFRSLLKARIEALQAQAANQKAQAEGGGPNRNVHSAFYTQDGKLGYLRKDGTQEVTDIDVLDKFEIRKLPDGSEIAVDRSNPANQFPVLTPEQAKGAEIRAKQNVAQAEATVGLAEKEILTDTAFNILYQMKDHPGKAAAVGVKGPTNYLPGTEAANFRALVDQVGGAAFSEA